MTKRRRRPARPTPIPVRIATACGRAVATLLATLAFAVAAHAASSMDDRFEGTSLDACKWEEASYEGNASQSGALALSTTGTGTFGSSRVLSQARLVGDFDVQVDYQRAVGFETTPVADYGSFAQLNVAIGLWWDESRFIQYSRTRHSNGEGLSVYASLPELAGVAMPWADAASATGTLRIVRAGTRIRFLHASGGAWTDVGAIDGPSTPVFVFLATVNVNVGRALVARFDNFVVQAGANDDVTWAQPGFHSRRPDFALGGVSENWPAFRYFGTSLANLDALALFRQNGMEWIRVGVTTVSRPQLDAVAPGLWSTLPWSPGTWGSREYAARTLRDAADRGMRLYAYLYFSDVAANWGNQTAPAAWAGKSVAETAALMEQHAYDTATYFKSKGLDVEIYELGNETDIGMVDFLPNRRIPVPPGVDFVNDRTWVRDNVWSVQATLLKAAAAGIRRAAPGARIAVHAASLESGAGPQMGPDFFLAMRDFGVDYDIAAISHPYAQGSRPWKLDRYSTACWFKRVARAVDQIVAPLRKPQGVRQLSQSLDEIIARRVAFLADYQDTAYAERYRARVAAMIEAEKARAPGKTGLAEAVARHLFKLMAIKDEYEVARLFSNGAFQKQVESAFEGDKLRYEFHMAPPLLSKRNKDGELIKQNFGPWMMTAFGWLAKFKGLRGGALDIFGKTAERRMERQLIVNYYLTVEELLAKLSLTNIGYTATQYALLSSFYALLGKMLKGFSGVAVERLETGRTLLEAYSLFFIGTALVGIPALLLCLRLTMRNHGPTDGTSREAA